MQRNHALIKTVLLAIILLPMLTVTSLASLSLAAEKSLQNTPEGKRLIKTIIVENYQPYTCINDKGVADGFSVDVLRAAARELGMAIFFRDHGNQ